MPNVKVNCLVRVNTDNELDFSEWLQYHIALGFDCVYVFDSGNRLWLDGLCEKYREHAVLVPRNDDWRFKKRIISTYNNRHPNTWAICLDDDEYLWMDFRNVRNIKQVIDAQENYIQAISIYVKYLSSEKPMKNRVGTKIDCFTHARQDPQGFNAPNDLTPNTSVTLFYAANPAVDPMVNPVTPAARGWCDVLGEMLNQGKLLAYMGSRSYDPSSYPVRCYKYALKSGVEMEFKPGTCPSGYVVADSSMQVARERLLRVPVNMNTEVLFAKNEVLTESVEEQVAPLTNEELAAENSLPITAGQIDELILAGKFIEDVSEMLTAKNKPFDADVLARVFARERAMIINSSGVYRKTYDLLKANATEAEILAEIKVGKTAYNRILKCLEVLDIGGYDEDKNAAAAAQSEEDAKAAAEVVAEDDMAKLTASFDESVMANKTTEAEQAELDAVDAEKKAKRKTARKSSSRKKKAADKVEATVDEQTVETTEKSEVDSDNLVDTVDLKAFGL